MKECDSLSFRANSGSLINQSDAGGAASFKGSDQVVDAKAHVVDSRAALLYEPANRRIRRFGLEQLDERLPGRQASNPGSVGVVQRDFGEPEDVAIEGKDLVEGADRDTDVRDARSSRGGWHAHGFWPSERRKIIDSWLGMTQPLGGRTKWRTQWQ